MDNIFPTPSPIFGGESVPGSENRYAGGESIPSDGRTPITPSSEDGRRADFGVSIPTPVSITAEPSRHLYTPSHSLTEQGKNERLSRFLLGSLPSREDTERICTASRHPSVLAHEIMTVPYITLDQRGLKTAECLLKIPEPNAHPVLISRHMLLLATLIQHLHPDLHKEIEDLSEPPRAMMERLADLAISHVTSNDELLGSIEGLECVMIESVYLANIGSLRRSWLASRRAMSIAQLIGISRSDHQAQYQVLDQNTKYHPELMWFRIVFLDRCLCLMLGLSQGSLDRSMASDVMLASDTPMGRLERLHCVIASRILERNESKPSSNDLALTRTLDVELQRAARSLPSKWWLVPSLDTASTDSEALFWSTRQLLAQVIHYNLLNQLHLPYMLRSSSAERKSEYSLIACVNASREVLSRFITLRSFNGIAYSCRTVDFFALMAAMTLLLAHLDSNLSETENLLAHQYHSDRAMIEKVQENMKEVNRLNSDTLSAQSADLLGRMLTIEVETADAYPRCARRVSVQEARTGTALLDQDDDAVVSVHIPYFGIIKIARDGISKEVTKLQDTTATTNRQGQSQIVDRSDHARTESFFTGGAQMRPSALPGPGKFPSVEVITPVRADYGQVEALSNMSSNNHAKTHGQLETFPIPTNCVNDDAASHFALQLQNGLSDSLLEHGEYPGLTAGGDDWAFQGVDMAFFESLMRSTGNEAC